MDLSRSQLHRSVKQAVEDELQTIHLENIENYLFVDSIQKLLHETCSTGDSNQESNQEILNCSTEFEALSSSDVATEDEISDTEFVAHQQHRACTEDKCREDGLKDMLGH